jgi:hypothetical protein
LFIALIFSLKFFLPSIFFLTRGKEGLCRVSKKTLDKEGSLPSVKKTLGKDLLCRVFFLTRGKEPSLPSILFVALGKEALCRVSEKKHSANH